MAHLAEKLPYSPFTHESIVHIVVRDGITGEIKETRIGHNDKLNATYSAIISALVGSGDTRINSIVICGVSSGDAIAITDVSLTGEIGTASDRTYGALSWDANAAMFNLSFSFTANTATFTIGTAGLFWTFTGDGLYLKASFARVQVKSQVSLYVAWTQSLASA